MWLDEARVSDGSNANGLAELVGVVTDDKYGGAGGYGTAACALAGTRSTLESVDRCTRKV